MEAKLKLKSKKLQSGKIQIGFSTEGFSDEYYGYLLAEPHTSVNEVIEKIEQNIRAASNSERYWQRNLFSVAPDSYRDEQRKTNRILIFKR